MLKPIDITGQKFNRLTVIQKVSLSTPGNTQWLCLCDCGKETLAKAKELRSGHKKSCGCLIIEKARAINFRHGMKKTAEHRAWSSMKQRCYNPNNPKFAQYGGRGVRVCDRWLQSFETFLQDMGMRPSVKHSVDRINVNGNYEPGNCRWATEKVQALNKTSNRIIKTPWGEITLREASEKSGINYNTLKSRLRYGYTGNKLFESEI